MELDPGYRFGLRGGWRQQVSQNPLHYIAEGLTLSARQ